MQRNIELRVPGATASERSQASISCEVASRISPGNLAAKRLRVVFN